MAKSIPRSTFRSSAVKPSNTAAPANRKKDLPDGLRELLASGIKELYWAETHLVLQVLPKVLQSAKSATLKKAITDHLKVTKGHIVRLEEVFQLLGLPPQAKKSDGLEGLAMEGEGIIDSTAPGSPAREAGLIMACQKVESYEITSYKGLASLANQLGEPDIATLLQQTMAEEQEAEDLLASLAGKV